MPYKLLVSSPVLIKITHPDYYNDKVFSYGMSNSLGETVYIDHKDYVNPGHFPTYEYNQVGLGKATLCMHQLSNGTYNVIIYGSIYKGRIEYFEYLNDALDVYELLMSVPYLRTIQDIEPLLPEYH